MIKFYACALQMIIKNEQCSACGWAYFGILCMYAVQGNCFCVKEGECYLAETLDFQVVFCVVSEYIFDKRHAFSGCYLFFQNCQQTYFALFTSGHHHTT